jgi:ubiquinone/menaquinone biosynthesis C-methylase UbiE
MPAVNFDPVARPYRWLEYLSFGPWLSRCRSAQLLHLAGAQRALLFGDGDGRFLASLLKANTTLTADVVDSSQSMLQILDRRIRRAGPQLHQRICLHHADALEWSPCASYDLVVSHFFLDCFFPHQLEQLLDRVLPHLQPGAQWVVSEFSIPHHATAARLAGGLIGLLYRAFGLLTGLPVRTLPDHAAALLRRGFVPLQDHRYLAGLLCSQLWLRPNIPPQK